MMIILLPFFRIRSMVDSWIRHSFEQKGLAVARLKEARRKTANYCRPLILCPLDLYQIRTPLCSAPV